MIIARQSTARTVMVGPVLDADGVAVTDGVVGDFKISKNGGAPAALNGSATLTHRNTGHYSLALTTSDLDTVGQAEIVIDDTVNACPVKELTVVEEAVYDALFAASALGYVANAPVNVAQFGGSNGTFASGRPEVNASHWGGTAVASTEVRVNLINIAGAAVSTTTAQLGVNAVQISGDGAAADNLENAYDNTAGPVRWLGIVDQGLVQSGSGTAVVIRAGASFAADELIGRTFAVVAGLGIGQSSTISDNDGADGLTLEAALVTALDGTSFYHIYPTAVSTGGSGLDAAGVRAAIGMASADLDTQLDAIKADTAAILVDTGTTLQGELDGIQADTEDIQSRLPAALVGGRIDATVDGTGMEAGAVTAIQSGLATAAELAKVPKSDGTATWNATAAAQIQSEANDALVAYDPPTKAELDAAVANVSVEEIQATALADLFNTNSATNYASAVAGSVVKEIADNAGGSALTTDAIAEAMFTYNATATYATADAGSVVKQIADNAGGSALTVEAIRAEIDANSTQLAAIVADTNELQTDWANGGRLDLILDARASQTSVDDLPTNAELATALGTADDAVLAAIAALNNLSSAQAQSAAAAALTAYDPPTRTEATSDANSILTAVGDVPTNAELTAALASADDAILAAIAALNNVSVANILGATVEGSTTLVQSLRLLNAAMGGKANGLETTSVHYRDLADTKDRILASVDSSGNRSSVTLDLT